MKKNIGVLTFIFVIIFFLFTSCKKDEIINEIINDTSTYVITPQFNVLKVIDNKISNFIKTSDGGYIGINPSGNYDIIKFDSDLNTIWYKTYGGSGADYVDAIINTQDGGYLIIGETNSNDGDITLNHGGYDIWICKLNSEGDLVWEKCYGGTGGEAVRMENSILETSDGGFKFIGYTDSDDGDISLNHGGYDAWLVKINSIGDIEFEKTFGGSENDFGKKIIETNNNSTILVTARSVDGDFTEAGNWVVQINENGDVLWKTNLYGSNSGFINTTVDDEIIAVNTDHKGFLLSKLDLNGNVILNHSIDFQSESYQQPWAIKIMQTADKGYLVIGSLGGHGDESDALLFRLTPEFNLLYNKIYAGNKEDMSASLIHLNNNDYIYQFFTSSTNIEGVEYQSWMASPLIKLEELVD